MGRVVQLLLLLSIGQAAGEHDDAREAVLRGESNQLVDVGRGPPDHARGALLQDEEPEGGDAEHLDGGDQRRGRRGGTAFLALLLGGGRAFRGRRVESVVAGARQHVRAVEGTDERVRQGR